MRLWHKDLISVLPQKQLVAQWRECCCVISNIAKNGTPNHILVNYVLDYSLDEFRCYTNEVLKVMRSRGYNPNPKMMRNQLLKRYSEQEVNKFIVLGKDISKRGLMIYKEHNNEYLQECLFNLKNKGIEI